MTEQEIIEGNKLIAKFDGWVLESEKKDPKDILKSWKKFSKSNGSKKECYEHDYHKRWDSLMLVVEKIETLGYEYSVNSQIIGFGTYMVAGEIDWHCEVDRDRKNLLQSIYEAVILFIKWYNTNKS